MLQERETRNSQGPEFVETIDRFGKVGILGDGTWLVGWKKVDGQLVWHRHGDIFHVFRQNERVIQKFLGVPVDESLNGGNSDPSLDVSLPQLEHSLMILGEVQKSHRLANIVSRVMALSVNKNTPASELSAQLALLKNELGEGVRNPLKVAARGKLAQAAVAENIAEAQLASVEAFNDLLFRTAEGMSIVKSLFDRAGKIIEWVDKQEQQIGFLRVSIGAVLREIQYAGQQRKQFSSQTVQNWQDRFFGPTSELLRAMAIRGNPYAQIMKKPEITRLEVLNGKMSPLNIPAIERRFEEVYIVLGNVMTDRERREASGLFARYRKKKT